MKDLFKNFSIVFTIFIFVCLIYILVAGDLKNKDSVSIDKLITQINSGEVKSIVVNDNELEITLKNDNKEISQKEAGGTLTELLNDFGIPKEKIAAINIDVKDNSKKDFWLSSVLYFILPTIVIGVLMFMMIRGIQGANSKAMMFGQSQAKEFGKDRKDRVTFKDVAGVKEAKEELVEVVDFLRNPQKFIELGARIPRGVLLLGSPGTGKTLLARAVAGEAEVPFFHISGSEFVEMFVGVGASRVRDLFKRAKKNAPCIIFIDEIDAVGRRRGAGLGGSHDEREQTLNQILVEMDGFEITTNIIVIAATNRPDVLDPALLRPGRFDRQVVLDNPDIRDREEILKIHAKNKPLSKDVSLRRIAERTPGFSGADLFNLLNEAAILTARDNKKIIEMDKLFEAIEKVMLGPERKSKVMNEKEKKVTAYHEAGHALVTHFLPHIDPVQKVSIIARGRAGGYVLKVPTEDRYMHTKTQYLEEIAVSLAGFMAEQEIFGEITTGATSDLRHATNTARRLITDYGMSDILGPRTFGEKEEMIFLGKEIHEQRDYSEKTAEQIDSEIAKFINYGKEKSLEIIRAQRAVLDKIYNVLLEKETIEKEDFEAIVGGAKTIIN